jgi:cytidylate kinase
MPVIALGGLTAGGGRIIGPKVAKKLNIEYVDKDIIKQAALQSGMDIELFTKKEEKPSSFSDSILQKISEILEKSAFAGAVGDPHFGPGAAAFLTHEFEDLASERNDDKYHLNDTDYSKGIQQTVLQLAELGSIVIVGRGANIILQSNPKILRVGLIAEEEDRIRRISLFEKVSLDEAKILMDNRDQARTQYFQKVFDIEDPDNRFNYHAVLNTSAMSFDAATDVIVDLAKDLHLEEN